MIDLLNFCRVYFWPIFATIACICVGVYMMVSTLTMMFVVDLFGIRLTNYELFKLMAIFVVGGLAEIYAVILIIRMVD